MTKEPMNILPGMDDVEKQRILAMLISSDGEMRDLAWVLIKNKIKNNGEQKDVLPGNDEVD